jgi:periplasmic protein CpxP/Spy
LRISLSYLKNTKITKRMKKLLLVCLLAVGASAMSFAQGGPGGGGMRGGGTPEQQLERLKTQITGITDAQSAKLLAIYAASAKRTDSLRTATGDDRTAYREKSAPITAERNAKVKAVLTPEQATAWQKAQDEQRARFGGGAPGGGGPRP